MDDKFYAIGTVSQAFKKDSVKLALRVSDITLVELIDALKYIDVDITSSNEINHINNNKSYVLNSGDISITIEKYECEDENSVEIGIVNSLRYSGNDFADGFKKIALIKDKIKDLYGKRILEFNQIDL